MVAMDIHMVVVVMDTHMALMPILTPMVMATPTLREEYLRVS